MTFPLLQYESNYVTLQLVYLSYKSQILPLISGKTQTWEAKTLKIADLVLSWCQWYDTYLHIKALMFIYLEEKLTVFKRRKY